MTNSEFVELSATLAEYMLEQTYLDNPYMEHENGDTTYTEEAQDVYNDHYGNIQDILGGFFDVAQHVTTETNND
jgi:hypothetical protein